MIPENKKTILVVDDSRTTRSYVMDILISSGYAVLEAENGVKALLAINKQVPDVMLLDLLMPEMDGFEVLEKLQEVKIHFPIIVVTADIQDEVQKECLALGAAAFLNKPVSQEILLDKLKTLLK